MFVCDVWLRCNCVMEACNSHKRLRNWDGRDAFTSLFVAFGVNTSFVRYFEQEYQEKGLGLLVTRRRELMTPEVPPDTQMIT